MSVILIASGEKLQHGHCKRNSSSGKAGLSRVRPNGLRPHTLVTATPQHGNDVKDFSNSPGMGTG